MVLSKYLGVELLDEIIRGSSVLVDMSVFQIACNQLTLS